MAIKILSKPTSKATEKPEARRSVTLISRALPSNLGMNPDCRAHFKTELSDLCVTIGNIRGLLDTFPLIEDSFVFAIETILRVGIEKLEHIHDNLERTISMLETAQKGGAR